MAEKYGGKELVVKVKPTGASGDPVDVSGESRDFETDDQAEEIDTTTRSSTAEESLDDFPKITGKFTGLDVVGGAPALELMPRGSAGLIEWYPEGEVVGKRKMSASYRVMGVNIKYPYRDAVQWEMSLKFTTAITEGTVPTP